MSGKNSTIFLGDLARAVCELKVSDPTGINLIAEMLGLSVELRDEITQPPPSPPPSGQKDEAAPATPDVADSGAEAAPEPARATRVEEQRKAIPVELKHTAGEKQTWIPEIEPLPSQDEGPVKPPPLIPLFMPRWTRGILSAALATWTDDGLLDIEGITEILARGEDVRRLPTLPTRTLAQGVQLLLDKSQSMMPFVRDQAWLLREIRNVVGTDKVEVLRFIGSPARGGAGRLKPHAQYQPPPAGTPVIVLSDLGICQQTLAADWAGEAEWAEFAGLVRRANCPLLALVPYQAARWPRTLARLMTIVQWDRHTTTATVASLLKDSHRANML